MVEIRISNDFGIGIGEERSESFKYDLRRKAT